MRALTRIDRRLGAGVRRASAATPGGPGLARALAAAMSPAFRVAVAVMILRRPTRVAGLRALAAGAGASLVARAVRDRLGRPRPGARSEGGFPSRHAAASVAIAVAAGRDHRRAGTALAVAAVAGLAARVADAEHEPADIVAGAAVGMLAARLVERIAPAG